MRTSLKTVLSCQGPELKALLASQGSIDSMEELYLAFRGAYLSGDLPEMRHLLTKYEALINQAPHWFRDLLEMRLAIRARTEVPESQFNQIKDHAWRGEAYMVLAMHLEDQGQDLPAKDHYRLSAASFLNAGYKRKALIARYNMLAAQTRLQSERKYFSELGELAAEARLEGHFDLAATVLSNLSRECHLAGAVQLALQYCDEALNLMKVHDNGSLQYHLTVAHQLNLLLQTGKWVAAVPYYEELKLSPFKEVEEIRAVIENYLDQSSRAEPYAHLPFTWRERLKNLFVEDLVLTEKEQALIEALVQGPRSIDELAAHIYGRKIDLQSGIARSKQLIHRLRRKAPDILDIRDGKYALV